MDRASPTLSPPVRLSAWLPPLTLAAIIFIASSRSVPSFVPRFPYSDKIIHFGVYSAFAFLLARALTASSVSPARALAIAVAGAFAYGILDEVHQSFVPSRTADVFDALTDGAGGLAGTFAYRWWLAFRSRR